MKKDTKQKNYICQKVIKLMKHKKVSTKKLVTIIDENSTKEIKSICPITLERINEIIQGSTPSLIECLLIGQALGKGLGYFHYNGYQIN